MSAKPKTIEEYISACPDSQQIVLRELRAIIAAAAPSADEAVSYGLPAFRVKGKNVVGFGASAKHYALYPMSGTAVEELADLLTGFQTSKGAIRFSWDAPIPRPVVEAVVAHRLRQVSQ